MTSADPLVEDSPTPADLVAARQRAHGLVAKSPVARVEALFDALAQQPQPSPVRPGDVGLLMVRGRVGGSGAAFNLGEVPVARAAVRIDGGVVGIGYVAGRDQRHAALAALSDAMVQSPVWRELVEAHVLAPLERVLALEQLELSRKAAATKVDFFTLVRTRTGS